MNFATWSEFLSMGGYGPYVWGSVGMCAAAVWAELALLAARRRALLDPGDMPLESELHEPTA